MTHEIHRHHHCGWLAGRRVCHVCRCRHQEKKPGNGPASGAVPSPGQEEILGHPLSQTPRLREELHAPKGITIDAAASDRPLLGIASLLSGRRYRAHTSSGQGTMVDLTVFIAIASLTARATPSSSKGSSVTIASQGYLSRARWSISTPSGRSLAVKPHEPSTLRSLAQMR